MIEARTLQDFNRGETGCGGNGIPMQSTINVGVVILAFTCRIDAVENFGFTRNATDGSATADDLAIGCEIRRDTKIFLGPTKCETDRKAGGDRRGIQVLP